MRLLLVESCGVPRRPADPFAVEHRLHYALAVEAVVDARLGSRRGPVRDARGGELALFGIPLGAAFLAGAARGRGVDVLHEPLILAAAAGRDPGAELRAAVGRDEPDVVGVTVNHTCEEAIALRLARAVKEARPAARVVLGGVHATFRARELAARAEVDAVLRFEGESSLAEYVEWAAGRREADAVPGLTARRDDGQVRETDPGPPPAFARAVPDYDAVHADRYARAGILAHVQTARGCPYACHFCLHHAFWGRTVRYRDPGLVAEELSDLARRGCDLVYLTDSTFTLHRQRVWDLTQAIAAHGPARLALVVETRLDRMDDELLSWLAHAGVAVVALGVETAAPEVLAHLPDKRAADPARGVREAVRRIRAHGMRAYASLVLGLPGETAATLDATVRLVHELYAEGDGLLWADAKLARAFPGTELARRPERFHAVVDGRAELYDFYGAVTLRLEGGATPEEIAAARLRIMEANVRAWRARRPGDAERVAREAARRDGGGEVGSGS
jgi:anaerobic magnesium-protoporphyrin IX monomethyl ester cyclase